MIRSQLSGLEMAGKLNNAHVGPVQVNIHGQVELQHGGMRRFQYLLRAFQKLLGELRIVVINVRNAVRLRSSG